MSDFEPKRRQLILAAVAIPLITGAPGVINAFEPNSQVSMRAENATRHALFLPGVSDGPNPEYYPVAGATLAAYGYNSSVYFPRGGYGDLKIWTAGFNDELKRITLPVTIIAFSAGGAYLQMCSYDHRPVSGSGQGFEAAILFDARDLFSFAKNDPRYNEVYGDPGYLREYYVRLEDPGRLVDKNKVGWWYVGWGRKDTVVKPLNGESLIARLRAKGRDFPTEHGEIIRNPTYLKEAVLAGDSRLVIS